MGWDELYLVRPHYRKLYELLENGAEEPYAVEGRNDGKGGQTVVALGVWTPREQGESDNHNRYIQGIKRYRNHKLWLRYMMPEQISQVDPE